jgi:hypothetical protein
MSIPGFRAEVTIYRSTIAYQAALASSEIPGSGMGPMLLFSRRRVGSGDGG